MIKWVVSLRKFFSEASNKEFGLFVDSLSMEEVESFEWSAANQTEVEISNALAKGFQSLIC